MAETIEDLDVVTLIRDLPEEGLPAGQAGTMVFVHNGGAAFEVEFMLSSGGRSWRQTREIFS